MSKKLLNRVIHRFKKGVYYNCDIEHPNLEVKDMLEWDEDVADEDVLKVIEQIGEAEFVDIDDDTQEVTAMPTPRSWEEVERKWKEVERKRKARRKWNKASDMVINEQISKHELDAFADEVTEEYNKQHKEEVNKLSRLWWQRMGVVVMTLVLAVVVQLIFIEWMVGCGESYVDADGVRHWYECVFLNFNPKGGQ